MHDNSNKKQVVVITGPSGAGKSTLSRKLAVELGYTADIDIENVNYMIVNGFKEIKADNESGCRLISVTLQAIQLDF